MANPKKHLFSFIITNTSGRVVGFVVIFITYQILNNVPFIKLPKHAVGRFIVRFILEIEEVDRQRLRFLQETKLL